MQAAQLQAAGHAKAAGCRCLGHGHTNGRGSAGHERASERTVEGPSGRLTGRVSSAKGPVGTCTPMCEFWLLT